MAEIGGRTDVPINVNLLRHMVFNSIRGYKVSYQEDYGSQVVIACDSKKYWRKDYFPNYKANRKKYREESGFDWPHIFETLNQIKQELKEVSPYPVIEVPGAEADDIIAVLAEWSYENLRDIVDVPYPFLIISGDHDFIQLQKFSHVKQFSPIQKRFVKTDITPAQYTLEHIIRGDKGDGVPNVFTGDDAIIHGERQTPVSSKKVNAWLQNPETLPLDDETFKRNFTRNKMLIDLSSIPVELKTEIINTFAEHPVKDRSRLLNFFVHNKMNNMIKYLGDF